MRALVRGSDSWVLAAWHEMDVCRSGRPIRSSLRTLRTPSCWLLYSEWRSISRWSCHHVTSGVGSPKCVETGSSLVSHLIRSPHSIKVINQSLTSWKFHKKKDPENDWKILKTSTKASNFFLKSWKFQNNNRKNGRKIPKIAKNPKILKSPSKSFQLRRLATLANHVNVLPFLSRIFKILNGHFWKAGDLVDIRPKTLGPVLDGWADASRGLLRDSSVLGLASGFSERRPPMTKLQLERWKISTINPTSNNQN